MKGCIVLLLIICGLPSGVSVMAQFPEPPSHKFLTPYSSFIYKIEDGNCWEYHYNIKDGRVIQQENFCNGNLTYRVEFDHDALGNVIREIATFDVNEGEIRDTIHIKHTYHDGLLTQKEIDYGIVEQYSEFNKLGKPGLVKVVDEDDISVFRKKIEYDLSGNTLLTVTASSYSNLEGKAIHQKATIHYTYNERNDVVEIHREFEPEQKFPIAMTGGPFLYEYEHFRYVYNEDGLWIEKFKTIQGKESLVATRNFIK